MDRTLPRVTRVGTALRSQGGRLNIRNRGVSKPLHGHV
jgi:hypothetical protein